MSKPVKPPLVFLCLADTVFEGEPTMATDAQRKVLGTEQSLENSAAPEGEDRTRNILEQT